MIVNCIECGAKIVKRTIYVGSDDNDPAINVDDFAQSDWYCPECHHTTCIDDIDRVDREDL